jgi:hypothetical protein
MKTNNKIKIKLIKDNFYVSQGSFCKLIEIPGATGNYYMTKGLPVYDFGEKVKLICITEGIKWLEENGYLKANNRLTSIKTNVALMLWHLINEQNIKTENKELLNFLKPVSGIKFIDRGGTNERTA